MNRPITYDPEALTSFNFVPGSSCVHIIHVIPPVPSENTVDIREAWQRSRVLVDRGVCFDVTGEEKMEGIYP
jgi:hypothetical protein